MRALLLGIHWGGERGGLDRYFTEVASNLVSTTDVAAVVLGPVQERPAFVFCGGDSRDHVARRLVRYASEARARGRDADVVVAHFAFLAALPTALPGLRRKPLVVHFHGPWAEESRAAGASRATQVAKHQVERLVYRRAARLIVLSEAFRDVLCESYAIPATLVEIIVPGVDLDRFTPGATPTGSPLVPEGAFVAFTARRLVPRMGLDILLRAWALVDGPRSCHLAIAGDGAERTRLEALAASLGIGARVHFLGRVSDDELVEWYRAADVTVVPSTELEGFGLVVLESLAAGTPVIASDVGGLGRIVSALDPSLVVPGGDRDALAQRLRTAVSEPESLPDSGACRRFAELHSWRTTASRCRYVYEDAMHPRRRVVYTDHCASLSGAEISLLRIAPEVSRLWDVHVVLGEDGPLASQLESRGVSVTVLALDRSLQAMTRAETDERGLQPSTLIRSAFYAIRLSRLLRELRADVVHSNSLKSAYYTSVAARLARVPFVWGAKDRLATDYLPRRLVQMSRLLAHRASAVIANSQATLDTVRDPRANQVVAVIGEPPSAHSSTGRRVNDGPVRVGIVGRIAPWKGQDVFLDAFAEAFPSGEERAVVIGAPLFGEIDFEAELHDRARRLGIVERVEFRGFRDDVDAELDRLDILVHASVIPEPFGMVIVEGMARGLPVIATQGGGPSEIITSGVDGLLVAPGDRGALASALRKLAYDRPRREQIGGRARQRAEDFDAAKIARQIVDVYDLVARAR